MCRTVIVDDGKLLLELEESGKTLAVHCVVKDWCLSVCKTIYDKMPELLDYAEAGGFDQIVTATPSPKFAELFGFEDMCIDTKIDGVVYRLYTYKLGE